MVNPAHVKALKGHKTDAKDCARMAELLECGLLHGSFIPSAAAANPLNLPLSGPVASAVTRGYHLSAMSGNRARVLADWVLNAATPPQTTSFGMISAESVPLDVDRPPALALESTPPDPSGGPR